MHHRKVGHYYLMECQRIIKPSDFVLKTDLNNEVLGTPTKGGIIGNICGTVDAIEYDATILAKGRELFPDLDLRQGDIRALPYEDDRYDVVLDLSTLDHIPEADTSKAISEYARVLKPGGVLLLFAWTGDAVPLPTWRATNQYYFMHELIESELQKHFIIAMCDVARYHDGVVLMEYECRKP